MSEPLEDLYLTWLYSQVGSVNLRNKTRTYWSLLRRLHRTEFVWLIPNDDNRVEDGRDLRRYFVQEQGLVVSDAWMEEGCSMLELLVVLARELSFQTGGECPDWFWHLISNLGILINDRDYNEEKELLVDAVLHRVIYRRYEPDGVGGLFPVNNPPKDLRLVELWYQLAFYVLEIP